MTEKYGDIEYLNEMHWKWRQAKVFEDKIFYGVFGNEKPDNYDDMPPYKCLQDWTTEYLNRDDVKKALNAQVNITWGACNWGKTMQYNTTDVNQPMQPIIEYLMNGEYGLKFTIYSGDDDTVCATLGLQQWIWNMGWDIKQEWSPWYYNDSIYGEQLGGYKVEFREAISVVTVHNAGHETPFFTPDRAIQVLINFLKE